MPLNPGDIKLIPPLQETYGGDRGSAVPTFRAFFNIRGTGPYSVMIPREGFNPQTMIAAIEQEAGKIVEVMDAFQ